MVEVGQGGTVKETVGVTSDVQVASRVLVGSGVNVKVEVGVGVGGRGVTVLEGMITNSGRGGVGKTVLQAEASKMHPRTNRFRGFFMFTADA